jgi:general secretion pathway protein D
MHARMKSVVRHGGRAHPRPSASIRGIRGVKVCLIATALLISPMLVAGAEAAKPAAPKATGPVTLNLKDADISALIDTVSETTGKNFIVDPRVKGKVTIVSSRPMNQHDIYQVFLSVLDVYGFSAIPAGNVIKIVPDANSKQMSVPVADAERPGSGDEVVTRVIELHNVSAAQLVPILRPLVPQQGHMAAYVPSNMMIVSDRASNIKRLVDIIDRIDIPSSEEIEVIPLQHASATEIVRILGTLDQQRKAARGAAAAGGEGEETPIVVADERTNSILLGGSKSGRLRLRTIISDLDTPLAPTGNTHVYYLRYAKAKDLVPVLTGVSASVEQQQPGGGAPQAQPAGAHKAPTNIQADENTNSLVITGSPDVIRSLEAVIKQLDIRRAQVMIEGILAEVSTSFSAELGVQWVADGTPGGSGPAGVINFGGTGPGSIAGVAGAVISPTPTSISAAIANGLTMGIGRFNSNTINFAALLRALKSNGSTNILSTPTLVTLDNQEAQIVVGQQVPFVTGSFVTTGAANVPTNPFQTIQRQNVGIDLKVRPQINEGNAVKLDIEQKIDSLSNQAGAVDLITNTRSIKTSLVVDDGEVVVLGGLIRDDLNESNDRVPLLGDLPLLGTLFRSKSTSKQKTNLMVFLKPTILRDAALLRELTSSKYDYIRAVQMGVRERGLLMMPSKEAPVIPTFNDMLKVPPRFEQQGGASKK